MKKNKPTASGFVYSTERLPQGSDAQQASQELPPKQQDLRVTLDKKLKGGKVATVIYNYAGPDAALEALGKRLKTRCGVGGAVKNGEIILQGNCLTTVQAELTALGYRYKLAGI